MDTGRRVGIADHFGWAVAVTTDADHRVVDRRRIELVEPGVCAAPIHYEGAGRSPADAEELVATVRTSVERATRAALTALPDGITGLSLRVWPADFPTDIATLLRSPWEARADAVMYRQVIAAVAGELGWQVMTYDAKRVESQATALLGPRAEAVLHGPRAELGPPWGSDQRRALAATVVARAAAAGA